MEQKFDEMSLAAMTLAEEELSQIAETEKLNNAQTVRLIAGASAKMQTLQKAEHPARLPDIRQKKRRLRLAGILLAAAVTVSALGIAVSGRLRYNKYAMERYFGAEGEARLAAMELPEQETVSNGTVSATADAFLYDGHRAVALVTFDSADTAHPIDWLGMMHQPHDSLLYYNCEVLDTQGNVLGTDVNPLTAQDPFWHTGSSVAWGRQKGSITAELTFVMPKLPEESQITLRFSDEAYGTLDVPVQLSQALPAVTLTDGSSNLYLSPIGLTADFSFGTDLPEDEGDLFALTLTDADGRVRRTRLDSFCCSVYPWSDGETDYTEGKLYEITEGMEYDSDKPETYSAFIDVSGVISAEWNGTVFTAAP